RGSAHVAEYFSGRKRLKGDTPGPAGASSGQGQGQGVLLERGGVAVDRGGDKGPDDTMEFMEGLGWLTREQREALSLQASPTRGPADEGGSPTREGSVASSGAGGAQEGSFPGGTEQGGSYSRSSTPSKGPRGRS
ncbi:unnamed protein product, partial [Discosporangium mesarthrocarpum]